MEKNKKWVVTNNLKSLKEVEKISKKLGGNLFAYMENRQQVLGPGRNIENIYETRSY